MSIVTAARRLSSRTTRPATIRATPATFGLGLVEVDAPDTWGAQVDASIARYRETTRKPTIEAPVALVIEADPLPMLASPIDGTGDMQDPNFYAKFAWSRELSARRLAVVKASVDRINAELDARDDENKEESFADELVNALAATPRPRSKFHPSPVDHAWELGYSLGRDGIAAASRHATHDETMAFLAGHDRGLTAYHDDQRDEVEALIAGWEADHGHEEHELAYAGSAVGHMA